MEPRARELEEELLHHFGRGVDVPLPEVEFNRLALAGFEHQFRNNPPYAAFCRARGWTSESVSSWREVPALPTAAFKVAELTTVSPGEVRVEYHTSGTTGIEGKPGRHLLPDTRLYDASLEPNFRAYLLPDVDQIRVLVLAPTARYFPHSSLGHMNSRVLERFGAPGSGVFWHDDGPRFGCFAAALRKSEADGVPVCLLGTAFGFVRFLDEIAANGRTFSLPPGSRIMDTGGYKGRSREVPKADLYSLYGSLLGVPLTHVVNEYGMTEMGSQFYDDVLQVSCGSGACPGERSGFGVRVFGCSGVRVLETGDGRPETGDPGRVRRKVAPPWVRTQVVDPETLEPLPAGQVGLLRHFDLANLHTVSHIQTDDLGVALEGRFEILGRAVGAEPRGCSLTAEEL